MQTADLAGTATNLINLTHQKTMAFLDYASLLFLLSHHNIILIRKALPEALCDQASDYLNSQIGFASVSFILAKELMGT